MQRFLSPVSLEVVIVHPGAGGSSWKRIEPFNYQPQAGLLVQLRNCGYMSAITYIFLFYFPSTADNKTYLRLLCLCDICFVCSFYYTYTHPERNRERERENCHTLAYSPRVFKGWDWAGLKPEAGNSNVGLSHVGQEPSSWSHYHCLLGLPWREAGFQSWRQQQTQLLPCGGSRCLTRSPNHHGKHLP